MGIGPITKKETLKATNTPATTRHLASNTVSQAWWELLESQDFNFYRPSHKWRSLWNFRTCFGSKNRCNSIVLCTAMRTRDRNWFLCECYFTANNY